MAEFTDADVGLAPSGPVEFSDADIGLAPAAPRPAPLDPANQPGLGDRFMLNAREAFQDTVAGEVRNRVRSGQLASDTASEMARALREATASGSPVGLDAFGDGRPSPYAAVPLQQLQEMQTQTAQEAERRNAEYTQLRGEQRREFAQLPSFTEAPSLWSKAVQGAVSLAGSVAGSLPTPENLIAAPVARGGAAARAAGESLPKYFGRMAAPGAAEGVAANVPANVAVQTGQVERGERPEFSGTELGEAVVLGAGIGASFRMVGPLYRELRASIARRKGVTPDSINPDSIGPQEIVDAINEDPVFAGAARANGIEGPDDPRFAVLQDRLAKRRIEESLRPAPDNYGADDRPVTSDDWRNTPKGVFSAEVQRRQDELANRGQANQETTTQNGVTAQTARATEEGTINPQAANVVPREPDTRPIAVQPDGGAYRADDATMQGRNREQVTREARTLRLPAPGREVPTDAEIARMRPAPEVPPVETPPKLYGSEDRAPQTSTDMVGQRQAGDAFTLAERQRARAGTDVRDTQVAGRPEGTNPQQVYLDDGFPVEIVSRNMMPDAKGNMVEVATVRRYDPRTGKPEADAVEYQIPVRQLKSKGYAAEPRMAQDFEARAETGRINAGRDRGKRMDDAQGLDRQTYRQTAPDPDPNTSGRFTRPEQPDGPSPFKPWSNYEEAMRDFADRQQRGQTEPPKSGPDYSKAKSSNQAGPKDRDGRFVVDENGYVMSSAKGPIRFADQKQAAKWILNVGQKQSPDQIFEIAVHPTGKGFTARERGRSETPPPGGKTGPEGAASATPRNGESASPQPSGPPRGLEGPRAERAPEPATAKPKESFQEQIARLKAERAPAEKLVRDAIESPNPKLVLEKGDKKLVLTKGMDGTDFRITSIDEQGPSGHRDYERGNGIYGVNGMVQEVQSALRDGYTVRQDTTRPTPKPSFDDKVRAERDRLWAEDMGRAKRSKSSNDRMVEAAARENVMRQEVGPEVIREAEATGAATRDDITDIAQLYRRKEGQSPQEAWEDAYASWVDKNEGEAMRDANIYTQEDIEFDPLKVDSNSEAAKIADVYTQEAQGIEREARISRESADNIPFDEVPNGKREADRPVDAAGRQDAPEQGAERGGTRQEAGGGRERARDYATDAGPDGGRQTVVPGAERDTRGANQRRADAPLRGGDEAPPRGGLFDEDARNQGDIFDGARKSDRAAGDPRPFDDEAPAAPKTVVSIKETSPGSWRVTFDGKVLGDSRGFTYSRAIQEAQELSGSRHPDRVFKSPETGEAPAAPKTEQIGPSTRVKTGPDDAPEYYDMSFRWNEQTKKLERHGRYADGETFVDQLYRDKDGNHSWFEGEDGGGYDNLWPVTFKSRAEAEALLERNKGNITQGEWRVDKKGAAKPLTPVERAYAEIQSLAKKEREGWTLADEAKAVGLTEAEAKSFMTMGKNRREPTPEQRAKLNKMLDARDAATAKSEAAEAAILKKHGVTPRQWDNFQERMNRLSDEKFRERHDDIVARGTTFYSNPFLDPAAWKGLAKSLGVHADYFNDLKSRLSTVREAWASSGGKKTNALADLGRAAFYSTDGELRAVGAVYKSPTIKKIADMLFAPADMGKGGAVTRSYHEAVEQRTISNLNKMADTLAAFRNDKAVLNQIRQLVQNPGNIRRGNPIHDAAAKLTDLLDSEFKYLKDAGVDVGKLVGYFPRIVDAERVLRNPSDFVEAATKQYMRDGIANSRTEAGKLAQAWLASVELGHAGARKDGTDFVMLGGTPNSDFRKERVFGRSIETDKNNPLAKYYLQDPIDVLTLHFQRTARRAEWARRFGDDLQGWKDLKEQIVKEGNVASLKQVVDAIAVSTGTQRAYQSDAARAAIGTLRTWGAIRLLPRATITSLSEVAMPAIRSGNLTRVLGDMVRTTSALVGGMKAERELAADLGLISNAIGDSILGRRYFAMEPGSKVQQDIMNAYFRRTGLEQFTAATRVMSVAAGQTFIRRLAADIEGASSRQKSSRAFLRELGVDDADGFAKWLMATNDGKPGLADLKKDTGREAEYRTALQRFNQQSSLNPNASTRPKWSNHPLGSLVFMLQSYAYAFQKQVLNRAATGVLEGVAGKGYTMADRATMLAPAMLLPALVAIQYGLAGPRDAVFGDPSSKPKTPEQEYMQAISRAGLTGVLDPYINMRTGARYDRDAATAVAGPVLGGLFQTLDAAVKFDVKNSDKTNTAERNLAKAMYDATLMPAAAVLGGFLPTPIGAAVIQGASSGAARNAFTSAVAGPKPVERPKPPQRPQPPRPPRP